jgi:sigma-E factor negative regulatory protein RseC
MSMSNAHAPNAACTVSDRVAAVVEAVDAAGAWITIVEPRGGCGRCHEPGGCGGVSLVNWQGTKRFWFPRAQWETPLEAGQPVWVVTASGAPLAAAWRVYGQPLVIGVVLAAVGHALLASFSSFAADGGAVALLVGTMLFVWRQAARRIRPVVRIVAR